MILKNKILIFYYNLCFLRRFLIVFKYIYKDENLNYNITLNLGIRYYSVLLIILRVWILGLRIICLESFKYSKLIIFLILLRVLIIFFSSLDLLIFYIFFEVRIIPIFFLIVYWGINPERVRASYYLMMYILLFSFPLLIYLINIYFFGGTFKFRVIVIIIENYEIRILKFLIIYIAFFIKIPIYLIHIWLPRAHVEAPVYGSIILAGVLLKMGGYGIIRLIEIFLSGRIKFSYLVFRVSIIGRILVRIICLIQVDIKRLVAYSSIVHINIIICSIITITKLGFIRRYIIIIAHGLCSSGIFYIVTLYYERSIRRILLLNKGILKILPSYRVWWFLFCVANFSFPFSINFIREVIILRVLINWERSIIVYLFFICFFRRVYSIYLYSYIQYGGRGGGRVIYLEKKIVFRLIKEILIIILHLLPLILLLLNIIIFI